MSKFIRISFKSARVTFKYTFEMARKIYTGETIPTYMIYKENDMDKIIDQFSGSCPKRTEDDLITDKKSDNPFNNVKNLIHFEQVSNMLHVFAGERPVSTFHTPVIDGKPMRTRLKEFDEIAKNGYVKIDTSYLYERNGEEFVVAEVIKHRKGGASNKKGFKDGLSKNMAFISWIKFHNYFFKKPENEQKVIDVFNKYTSRPFDAEHYANVNEAINELKKNGKIDSFLAEEDIKKAQITCMVNSSSAIFKPKNGTHVHNIMNAGSFPSLTISISGEFVFEVPDNIYERIAKGTKSASFLDDGVALLRKWEGSNTYFSRKYEHDMMLYLENNDFNKISDLDIR